MTVFADEVETYLAGVPGRYREPLRAVAEVLVAKLGIEPKISYGIIAFTLSGKYGIYISGWKDHMSFHGGHFLEPLAEAHPEWFTRKGATLWFQDEPALPITAIDAVIEARLASMPEELIPQHLQR